MSSYNKNCLAGEVRQALRWLCMFMAGMLVMVPPVAAQSPFYDFGFIGGGIESESSAFNVSGSTDVTVKPSVFYNGRYGFVDGTLANIAVLPWVGVSGHWRSAEVSSEVNDIPLGISEREGQGELGFTLGTVGARITYLQDVSNVHRGYEVQVHLGRAFGTPVHSLTLAPFLEFDYRDQRLSGHLYNISNEEATASGLNVFQSGSTWVYQSGIIALYQPPGRWLGLLKAEFTHHDNDSPLIQNNVGRAVTVSLAYKFLDAR